MRAVIFGLVILLASPAVLARGPFSSLEGLRARVHTKKAIHNDLFSKVLVGAVTSSSSPNDFYSTYVVPAFKHDKKSLRSARRVFSQMKRMPKVTAGPGWVEFSEGEEKLRLEIVDAQKLQFKINGQSWAYDPSAPLWMQIEVLERKFKTESASLWPWFFIEEAHAIPWMAAIPPAVAIIVGGISSWYTNWNSSKEGVEQFSASVAAKELGTDEKTALKCFATRSWDSPEFETCRTGGRFEAYKRDVNALAIKSVTRNCLTEEFPITEILIEYEDSNQDVDAVYILVYYPRESAGSVVLPEAMEILQLKDGKLADQGKLSILFDEQTTKARKTPIISTIDQIKHKSDLSFENLKIQTRDRNSYYARLNALKYQLRSTTLNNAGIERQLLYHKRYAKLSPEASAKIKQLHDQILDQVTTYTELCRTKADFDLVTPTSLPAIQQKAEETKLEEKVRTAQ